MSNKKSYHLGHYLVMGAIILSGVAVLGGVGTVLGHLLLESATPESGGPDYALVHTAAGLGVLVGGTAVCIVIGYLVLDGGPAITSRLSAWRAHFRGEGDE